MAHFAKIEDGVVTQVIVVDNKDCADANGVEKEHIGAAFCERLFSGTWKQTSYNGNKRKHYAGIGYSFDAERDAFIPPKPYNSWLLNEKLACGMRLLPCLKMQELVSLLRDTHGMKILHLGIYNQNKINPA
jgi:hypothetical protein